MHEIYYCFLALFNSSAQGSAENMVENKKLCHKCVVNKGGTQKRETEKDFQKHVENGLSFRPWPSVTGSV